MSSGQYSSVQGAAITIKSNGTLTDSYVRYPTTIAEAGPADMGSWTSVTVFVTIGTAQAKTCNLKFSWSHDGTTWFNEQVEVAGTASAPDQPYTPYDRRVDLSLADNSITYSCRFNRMAKYFTVLAKSDATTTGTVAILVQKTALSN